MKKRRIASNLNCLNYSNDLYKPNYEMQTNMHPQNVISLVDEDLPRTQKAPTGAFAAALRSNVQDDVPRRGERGDATRLTIKQKRIVPKNELY